MNEEGWFERFARHERELGRSEARTDAADAAIARIASEMKDGFAKLERLQEAGFNHLRGEMKSTAEAQERQRRLDMDGVSAAITQNGEASSSFRRTLFRVAWAIVAAVLAAATGQLALGGHLPGMAGMAATAIQNTQQAP